MKVEIIRNDGTTDTVTTLIKDSEFEKIATLGIGSCRMRIFNADGAYSNLYTGGEIIRFYAEHTDASTTNKKQFEGRLDYPKDTIKQDGHFLEIEGRHISYSLSEVKVYANFSGVDGATVLKNIITNFLSGYGFTTNNITDPIGTNIEVVWSGKIFWDCVKDICTQTGSDCYVDDNKDFHLFKENSDGTMNYDEAVVEGEGHNLVDVFDWGEDTYEKRDKIIVQGIDNEGLPIIYPAGTGTRPITIFSNDIRTYEQAQLIGDKKLEELKNLPPRAKVRVFGMQDLDPGDNIWVWIPRVKITGIYKIQKFKQIFNKEGWFTDLTIEREIRDISQILAERATAEEQLKPVLNIDDLEQSYNFTFDDNSNILQLTNTEITQGRLQLTSGQAQGTMESASRNTNNDISKIKMKVVGSDITSTTFQISLNDGTIYQDIQKDTLYTVGSNFNHTGRNLRIKVNLLSNTANPNPLIESLVCLYK